MRRIVLLSAWLILLFSAENVFSQCTNTSPYGSATAPTGGGSTTISTCNYASEYAPIYSVVAGATYIATSSVTTDFITVRQGTSNGALIAYGTTPLTWTATVAGTYYIHYNTNSSCGTEDVCRTTTIGHVLAGCLNTYSYGNATAPTEGGLVIIDNCQFPGDYATISSIMAGATYISTSSVTTDFITVRQGTYNGALIAYGTTPLTWTATVAGTYYIHYNTNSSCGTQSSCRTTTIVSVVPQCLNTTQYPSGCITAPTNGATTTISFAQYASEYNCITGVVAGERYISSTSTSTDFITVRQGSYNGAIIASGQTPLTWTAAIAGNYYVHYNTNSNCGIDYVGRTSYITHVLNLIVPASGNNSYTTCSGSIYDNGGASGNYTNSNTGYTTIYPGTPGNAIRLTGNYDTESSYDYLYIYNGVGIGGALLFSGSGAGSIPTLTSSDASGALTIRFTSDGSVAYSGFSLTISCVVPEMVIPASGSNSYTVCSGSLYDSGGSLGNYINNNSGQTVLYPTSSTSVVTISGTTSGEACCDYVRIYNGVGTGGAILGTYHMGTAIPTLSSTDETGALTILFYSDGSIVGAGINISISCSDRPDYLSNFISMDIGSTTWCAGETREVSVTIKNIGNNTWNTEYTTNVGVKWNADDDYDFRVNAGNLVPGATQTYYLDVTAPTTTGNNNLTFDVVNEGNCWFANNYNSCGPGNSVYTSAPITILEQINVVTGANQIMCSGANINLSSSATNSFPNVTGTNSTSYSIPDANATGVSSPITISTSGNANEITSVRVNIIHTWDGDLTLILIAPNGSSVILSDRRGGSGDNFVNTVFQSTGTAIASGTAPFTGNFIPEAPFSSLTGTANGTWYLRAVDGAGGDVGTINNWTLTMSIIPIYSWTGPNGFTSNLQNPIIAGAGESYGGVYTCTISSTGRCSGTNTSVMTINPDPAVSITGPDVTYNNDIAEYSVSSLTGGSGNWSYAWYFKPSTSPTFSAISNGVANVPYYSDAIGANTSDLTLTLYSLSEGYDYEVYCLVSNDGISCNQASSNTILTSIEHNLPIELGKFEAECFENYIMVEWTTLSEINNEWFSLEKSFDGRIWEEIIKIPGAGNSNQALVYSYIDKKNIGSSQYYRLTQIDYDNTSKTFEMISASCDSPINRPIEIWPNPTKSILNINDNNNIIEKIEVVNDLGQTLMWFDSNKRILDISGLKPGIYILRINEQATKIVKQ